MKTEIATTQDQSLRLLRCGVSADTADMCWYIESGEINIEKLRLDTWLIGCSYEDPKRQYEYLPAWSLSRLLELIPQREIAPHGDTPCDLRIYHYPKFWVVMYHDGKTSGDPEDYMWQCASEQRAKTLIEACVMMIEWLNPKIDEQ